MKDLLKKIKRANIPNTYYALIAVAFFAIVGVVQLAGVAVEKKRINTDTAQPHLEKQLSEASQKMEEVIMLGMPRPEVLRQLGTPTWAVTPEDASPLAPPPGEDFGLEWHWSNPGCRDAVVYFSPDNRVVGWDAGADYCSSGGTPDFEELACTRPERAALCR